MPQVDRTKEHYEVDYVGAVRFTHRPSGDTCLRHPWMVGAAATAWTEKLRAFLARHPDCRMVANGRGDVVGDARDFPAVGGGFAVGDRIAVIDDRTGEAGLVREVVAEVPNGSAESREPDAAAVSYLLEDGGLLYWGTGGDRWLAEVRRGGESAVARRALPEEVARPDLAYSSGDLLTDVIPGLIRTLAVVRDGQRLSAVCGDYGSSEPLRGEVQAAIAALSDARQDLYADRRSEALAEAGAQAVAAAAELARRLLDLAEARGVAFGDLGRLAERAEAVAGTMRRRGVLPEEPTAGPRP